MAAGLAALAFATFAPAWRCGFVSFDDPDYVTRNPHVTAGLTPAGFRWAFTTFTNSNWHPLTWLSLQLDATLWDGPDPRGFHLTNVIVHAADAALLFLALRALTGATWRSAAVALLFAVHPLRVESVAWVSERKDVLGAFFGLLALWAYATYARRPTVTNYLAVALAFAASLLCKPMLVTLPCLLLVLDWWPLARACVARDWQRLAGEKLPLFALVAAAAAVSYRAQLEQSAVGSLDKFPLAVRVENAAVSYATYLVKTVWPTDLAVYYPHPIYDNRPGGGLTAAKVLASALPLAALTVAAVALRRRSPYVLAGWLWYLGTLVPVIGLVQVGGQAYADRYTYFPHIGLLLAACWGAADLAVGRARVALAAGAVAAAALAVTTVHQLAYWKDSVALWRHALEATFSTATAELNLGVSLEERGDVAGAAACYRRALEYEPDSVWAHVNMGNALCLQGHLDEAIRHLRFAVAKAPQIAEYACNLGRMLEQRGDLAGATDWYRRAIALKAGYAYAHFRLGGAFLQQNRGDEAVAEFNAALRCDPRSAEAHGMLGTVLESRGDLSGAAEHFEQETRYNPDEALPWFNLGRVRLRQGRKDEAARCLQRAKELQAPRP
jgi:tetratricopeptide (TPR) repeat protein